jgi:hypothetical protein
MVENKDGDVMILYTCVRLRGGILSFVRAARNPRLTWRNADKCTTRR